MISPLFLNWLFQPCVCALEIGYNKTPVSKQSDFETGVDFIHSRYHSNCALCFCKAFAPHRSQTTSYAFTQQSREPYFFASRCSGLRLGREGLFAITHIGFHHPPILCAVFLHAFFVIAFIWIIARIAYFVKGGFRFFLLQKQESARDSLVKLFQC